MRHLMRSFWLPLVAAFLWLWTAPAAAAVTFDWVTVGRPGNACDPQSFGCYGAVDYTYRIATHEVTNAQYAEFLNAKAASDPLGLYNTGMASGNGGITRSGSDGSYIYSAIPGRENMPVNRVSYFDALRFVNWLHNGQGDGDTETGAYTLLGGTPTPSNELVARNPGAQIFIPTDAEWYKAAFYDTASGSYFDYPTWTDTLITCSVPTAAPNTANCGGAVGDFTPVGSYPGTPGPNGTFDQGGNIREWTDEIIVLEQRAFRGGYYNSPAEDLGADDVNNLDYDDPWHESHIVGFRIATLADNTGNEDCGDGTCEGPENALTCPADCPDVCGDSVCTGDEDTTNCASDCGSACGDGVCNGDEDTTNCVPDCGQDCGDGVCNGSESSATCIPDCGSVCGDGFVGGNEQCEDGVPLDDSCQSLGFDGGDLTCDASTCTYDTSDCTENACLPRWARCSNDSQCCSGDCRWWRRCR